MFNHKKCGEKINQVRQFPFFIFKFSFQMTNEFEINFSPINYCRCTTFLLINYIYI